MTRTRTVIGADGVKSREEITDEEYEADKARLKPKPVGQFLDEQSGRPGWFTRLRAAWGKMRRSALKDLTSV